MVISNVILREQVEGGKQDIEVLKEELEMQKDGVTSLLEINETLTSKTSELEATIDDLIMDREERDQVIEELNKTVQETEERAKKAEDRAKKTQTTRSTIASSKPQDKSGTFDVTAYCACKKCCGPNAKGITATGTKVQANRTIAVDPKVIPLGSKVTVEGYGTYIAEDTGSAVKGNIVDIYLESHSEANKFGRKKGVKVSW